MSKQQYLAFEVGGRRYCASLLQIREVKKIGAITIIPQSAPDMLGVINLRGEIVPLIDLQARIARCSAKAATDRMICIIVQSEQRLCAVWVDKVLDVMEFAVDEILPIPSSMFAYSQKAFTGIVAQQSDFVIVISLWILTEQEDSLTRQLEPC